MKKFLPFVLLLLVACPAQAGSVQFSTYYPAPFGMYDRLRLVPRAAIGTPCDPGTLYIDSGAGNQLEVCNAAGNAWAPLSGGPWTQVGSNIYATDTTAKVGIGTTTPATKLHVEAAGGSAIRLTDSLMASAGVELTPQGSGYRLSTISTNPLSLGVNNTEVITINASTNVGIGTTTPRTRLELGNDGAILATGTFGSGWTEPNLGAGTRLLWYPRQAAFRMGGIDGTQWNNANIGNYSVAMGWNTLASDTGAVALGDTVTVNGIGTIALGKNITLPAASDYSLAFGYEITSTSLGTGAIGAYLATTANGAAVIGSGVSAAQKLTNNTANSLAIGFNSTIPTLFVGTSGGTGTTGNVGIGTTTPANKLDVEGGMAVGATYSGTTAAPTNGMIVEGNVGIGTNNPGAKLDVQGGFIKATGGLIIETRTTNPMTPLTGQIWLCTDTGDATPCNGI